MHSCSLNCHCERSSTWSWLFKSRQSENTKSQPRLLSATGSFLKHSDLLDLLQSLPADHRIFNLPSNASPSLIPSISFRGPILHTRVVIGSLLGGMYEDPEHLVFHLLSSFHLDSNASGASRGRVAKLLGIFFHLKWKWKSLSCIQLFATPWTLENMEFSRPEYWSG